MIKISYFENLIVSPSKPILQDVEIDKNYPITKSKEDYEYIMQLNRRTVFSVLSKDYVNPNAPKEGPKKKTDDDDE